MLWEFLLPFADKYCTLYDVIGNKGRAEVEASIFWMRKTFVLISDEQRLGGHRYWYNEDYTEAQAGLVNAVRAMERRLRSNGCLNPSATTTN